MKDLFSIDLIICTYNNANLLKQAVAAITQLKIPAFVDCGLLVVNNNCTDETVTTIEEFINKTTIPIKTVIETKQGLTEARVCGVKNTSRNWIGFIDDDCILAEDWIVQAADFVAMHPLCGMFGSRIKLVFENEPTPFVHNFPFAFAGKNHGDAAKPIQAVAGAGMVVKRAALEGCGWISKQLLSDRSGNHLISGGDMEIALRVGKEQELWYNPACRIDHIIPAHRTTKKYLRRILFGLGASRHHVNALTWGGTYYSWLPYSAIYSIGMFVMGLANLIKEIFEGKGRAGTRIAFSPFFGWNTAIRAMLVMKPGERKAIIGAACKKK